MKKAVCAIPVKPEYLLIDGNMIIDLETSAESIIKGDSKSASIAAASIIAKVTRDRIMKKLHDEYPQYGFDKHKGYPTKLHVERLCEYGVLPVHRKSYGPVKKVLGL